MRYYVDTCVWLNIFKNEGWQGVSSERFIQNAIRSSDQVFYSGEVLRELRRKLGSSYTAAKEHIEEFFVLDVISEDTRNARVLESYYAFEISFSDLIHLCISKRMNVTLVTRDKQLMAICKEQGVSTGTPEELTFP